MSLLNNLRDQRRQHLEDRLAAAQADLNQLMTWHDDVRKQVTAARAQADTARACNLNLEATRLTKQIVLKGKEVDELYDRLSRV